MKLEDKIVSAIVTLASKCIRATQTHGLLFPSALVFIFIAISSIAWIKLKRQQQEETSCSSLGYSTNNDVTRNIDGNSSTNKVSTSNVYFVCAVIMGIISVGLSLINNDNNFRQTFEKRDKYVNEYYDQHPNHHSLGISRSVPGHGLQYINGQWVKKIRDDNDTTEELHKIRFRGVNLPAKTPSAPANLRNTRQSQQFYESKRYVSFVDRPFPLQDAHIHFRRLSQDWGFNLIRLSVTWEAVMHEGPGIIDQAYLSYLKELVALAREYGLYIIIDPHQDVWSRFTGGDGAPWWTLDAVGFRTDSAVLHDTGSAVLHQFWGLDGEDMAMPKMMWTTNYWKLATATMFTLFFAGDVYAPGITVDTMEYPDNVQCEEGNKPSIQTFLQRYYLKYIDAVAYAVKEYPNVIGFGTMNEPSNGFVGVSNFNEVLGPTPHGHVLSGFDSIRLGSGESLAVPYFSSHFQFDHHAILNPNGQSAYKSQVHDVWLKAGVYSINEETKERVLLRPYHFALKDGEDFMHTFLKPVWESVQDTVQRHSPHLVTYAEPHFDPTDPYHSAPKYLAQNSNGWAPHWYDAVTLFLGYYSHWFSFDFDWNIPIVTSLAIDWSFRKNLRKLKNGCKDVHVIVGETGVPHSGINIDYTRSLDRTLRAMEINDLDYIIWCYDAANDNINGDLWNGENLSLLANGHHGRGLQSAIRPYSYQHSTGLEVVWQHFNPLEETYEIDFVDGVECDHEFDHHCIARIFLFVPSCQFHEPTFFASGTLNYDSASQILEWLIHSRVKGSTYGLKIVSRSPI
jgi:hypothetical protein